MGFTLPLPLWIWQCLSVKPNLALNSKFCLSFPSAGSYRPVPSHFGWGQLSFTSVLFGVGLDHRQETISTSPRESWESVGQMSVTLVHSVLVGPWSPREENRAIFLEVQKKVFLQASLIGWHLIFSDQLKNLKTYPRGQILQEAKEVGSLMNRLLCKLDNVWIHPGGRPVTYLGPQSLPLRLWHTQTSPRIMFCCVKVKTLSLTWKLQQTPHPEESRVTKEAQKK